ncbi:MAG: DUF1330 domain-containing protein [Hyphomicrobiales bacterium]|nr:DUF1330 domain-containing protein [Hyphomicrobiales bacterium]MBV8426066.1 DUF1330 domain-containing protein [Hyphomicrobiales bacterium]
MAGYLIANLTIHDPKLFEEYRREVAPLVTRFNGRYLVRGGKLRTLEGSAMFKRLIVLEFPSLADAERFYASPEYAPILKLRLASATGDVVLAEGYSG